MAKGLTVFRCSRRATLPELQEWPFVCSASLQRRLLKSEWVGDEFSLSKVSSFVKVRHYFLKANGNLAILTEVYTEFTNSFVVWFIKAISEP